MLQETKPTILVVDDNEDILEYLTQMLQANYAVVTAENGNQAAAILGEENIHLVISDVMMPGMDGFALCQQIKTSFESSHVPVILLTAKNTLQSKIEGLECGADAYIEKPFSPQHLKVQVANLLANRTKIKEYFAQSPVSHINSMAYSKSDTQFLERLNEVISKNIENTALDVDLLAVELNMSRATLYRKIKGISNLSPNELINITRLKKAAGLLLATDCRINEVYHQVGYSSQKYFSSSFHKQFGTTPTEYIQLKKSGH
ncbi:response regulator transcription factor [Deminuibacter soli]|uniref:DNA-binding response regulator n=1 Tax=Deminuibacter soli TaxID=2291815 RepID=A0A3E1NGE0_9BACT|nr:response regulator [Deminuibacter soli]RFM27033.1 DNA-binding response regulator [Deminuibacter soli]